ncbi:hypothetical protein P7D22_19575 [Lichenihabitans sp. Uapishka_5]|uniref:hypothetical protein n=1 Tax=Lichenihabitans sp. Uapishka_5 TaxID=3037302 RepID=UPI0029E7FCD9|nr:hypothetical protein [Lichenihabitans sp. Uapishka_5]MDX7953368.1 hypothetical protein [Lichenihabitans sp. Uapishka_5]
MFVEPNFYRPPVPPLRTLDAGGYAVPLYEPPIGHPDKAVWIGLDALLAALAIPEASQTSFIATAGLVSANQGKVRTISPVLADLYIHNAVRFGFVSAERAGVIRTALDLQEASHAAI